MVGTDYGRSTEELRSVNGEGGGEVEASDGGKVPGQQSTATAGANSSQ